MISALIRHRDESRYEQNLQYVHIQYYKSITFEWTDSAS